MGWVGGQDAIDIESQTDEEILEGNMRNLRVMFPAIRRPDRVVVTRWRQTPNVLGTYVFKKVGRKFGADQYHLG